VANVHRGGCGSRLPRRPGRAAAPTFSSCRWTQHVSNDTRTCSRAHVAQALADVATIGILQERAIHRSDEVTLQLQTALKSRVVIEQAKGMLAEHCNVDMATAFAALRRYARDHNLKLSLLDREVVDGTVPRTAVVAPPAPQAG
jgi:hypothetical protein